MGILCNVELLTAGAAMLMALLGSMLVGRWQPAAVAVMAKRGKHYHVRTPVRKSLPLRKQGGNKSSRVELCTGRAAMHAALLGDVPVEGGGLASALQRTRVASVFKLISSETRRASCVPCGAGPGASLI